MNTAFILAIIVLGALSAALGAMLAAARREAGHLRADKTAAEQARLQAEADIRVQIETRLRTETELAALRASSQTEIAGLKQRTPRSAPPRKPNANSSKSVSACNSKTSRRRFWASSRSGSRRPAGSRSTSF